MRLRHRVDPISSISLRMIWDGQMSDITIVSFRRPISMNFHHRASGLRDTMSIQCAFAEISISFILCLCFLRSPNSVIIYGYAYNYRCTPTRAALMTGKYASNTGLVWAMVPGSPAGLTDDLVTLPQELRRLGYRTAMAGNGEYQYFT